MDIVDPMTEAVNNSNFTRWSAEMNKATIAARSCIVIGIMPDGRIKCFPANQMETHHVAKILRALAEAYESVGNEHIIPRIK